ncbi:protein WVD2-like 4 [Zingiber officinale]|uniref:protein WVD2-like 4 n=1 Tax=Zingiber officinale TaxID=94328 RepID=UPI001C4CF3F8|nr:protein WVD2-like 4 [Zingiber officinale]
MESGAIHELEFQKEMADKDPVVNGVGPNVIEEDSNHYVDTVEAITRCTKKSDGEVVDTSEEVNEGSVSVAGIKSSNSVETLRSGEDVQSEKAQTDKGSHNGHSNELQKKKSALVPSHSFPSKGHVGASGRKNSAIIVQPKDAPSTINPIHPGKQPSLTTGTCTRRSLPAKTGSVDASVEDIASETGIGSPRSRRSTISGFSFRLDERAEKRKEFFMKLEEKNHAKEVEQTNLQEKSKENQEAEIRRLRKTLTFKATPMPNFYQEHGPPKVELKKIPPTRARSPKLGRRNPSNTIIEKTSEATWSMHLAPTTKLNETAATNQGRSSSKKPIERSLAKFPSQKSKPASLEAKPAAAKPKISIRRAKVEKVKPEANIVTTTEVATETIPILELAPESRDEECNPDVNSPNTEISSLEVSAQG